MVFAAIFAVALPLLDFATNSIARRIAGADPAVCLSRFVDYPPSKGKLGFPRCLWETPFPANERFWLKDVDLSCASPWNDAIGRLGAGTAVSKRHILYSKHFYMGKGTRILFVGQDGGVCPCYLEDSCKVSGVGLMVGLLNAELTPNIVPAKVLPPDYAKYIGDGVGFPIITFNQSEEVVLCESRCESLNAPYSWGGHSSTNSGWSAYNKKIIKGDSGNPAFLLFGNQPILIYCLFGGGFGTGNPIHRYRREIQQAMDELCPGYKLEEFDFQRLKSEMVDKWKNDVAQ